MPTAFCPECQATWEQPWYDVCPACGHHFTPRKSVIPALLLNLPGPVALILAAYFTGSGQADSGSVSRLLEAVVPSAIFLIPAGSLASAVMLAKRTSYPTAGKVALGVLFFVGLLAVNIAIAFGGCLLTLKLLDQ